MDPLAQLKDIHLPTPVSDLPIAPGWWILLVLAISLCVWSVMAWVRYRKVRKTQRKLLAALASADTLASSSQLLKLALVSYYPRQDTAKLFGSNLRAFLVAALPPKKQASFDQLMPENIAGIYQANADINLNDFNQAIRFWLTHALPAPKAHKKTYTNKMKTNAVRGQDD
ncbi:DUF4381 domain-containing protein [Thalassotalea euphylliae]|uniref:DUF4381 domain-containing protein n=1 Tax=Thalassotalea euphylliae TaxID=1655234 RepID=A0A3E0TQ27_9GAMM|nr:DUF4381 domain-containing protein [Thalassotalea euphylliae]REL26162.1 DUF4381 domain-containing protein [Thalassotalea euphylliae]